MDKPAVLLRRAIVEDLQEVQDLFVETIRHACKNDYNQAQINVWTSSVENRLRWLNKVSRQFFLVAQLGRKIVGFGSLERDYLDVLYVHRDHLRQGIANMIYLALEQEAKRNGAAAIISDVSKTARPFFEKKGFTIVKENKNIIGGVEIVNYRMSKKI